MRHHLVKSGQVIWCNVCGAFGSQRGRGLAHSCPGPAQVGGTGGRAQQLRRLRAGFHPKDRSKLPAAIPQADWSADELSQAQRALATLPWLLESHHEPEGTGWASGWTEQPSPSRPGPPTATEDSDVDILKRTEFGRLCLQLRNQKRSTPQPTTSAAQVRMQELLRRVRLREISAASSPREADNSRFDLSQELAAVIDDAEGHRDEAYVRKDASGSPLSASHARVAAEKASLSRPFGATDEERNDLRWLRHRQADSGGHPVGDSDDEPQPAEWDSLDLHDYRDWVASGRPDVIVQGRPSAGAWDHPWVVYAHGDAAGAGGAPVDNAQDDPMVSDATDVKEYATADKGVRLCIPPLPVM